jgi:hypothetical protein
MNRVQPASFLLGPVAAFSRHSREQYSDMRDPAPIARSAGIQVPQETQRTSLFSILVDRAREPEDESFSSVPLRADNTFCRS